MGRVNFPLENIRKDAVNSWHMYHYTNDTAENFTIPENPNKYGYYSIFLKERPDNASIPNVSSRPKIDGYEEYIGIPIDADLNLKLNEKQFYVNYDTGEIIFHPNSAGDIIYVDYWGKGSVIESEDINYLYDNINEINENLITSFTEFKINGKDEIFLPIQTYFADTGYLDFTWSIQASNLKENTIQIKDLTNNIIVGQNLENIGIAVLPYKRIYKDTYYEIIFEISIETISGYIIRKQLKVFWDNVIYYGSVDSKLMSENINLNDLNYSLFHQFTSIFECTKNYLIILIPSNYGEPSSIIDNETNLSIVIDQKKIIKPIVSSEDISQDYTVYFSKYKLEPNTKIKVIL